MLTWTGYHTAEVVLTGREATSVEMKHHLAYRAQQERRRAEQIEAAVIAAAVQQQRQEQ